jgi:hypothetical protein
LFFTLFFVPFSVFKVHHKWQRNQQKGFIGTNSQWQGVCRCGLNRPLFFIFVFHSQTEEGKMYADISSLATEGHNCQGKREA